MQLLKVNSTVFFCFASSNICNFHWEFSVGDSEGYSFLMPVLKALLEKSRSILSLDSNVPDLPSPSSGPVFLNDFQMYSGSKQWKTFIEKKVSKTSHSFAFFHRFFLY